MVSHLISSILWDMNEGMRSGTSGGSARISTDHFEQRGNPDERHRLIYRYISSKASEECSTRVLRGERAALCR